MVDAQPAIMLIVRGLKSELAREEFERRYKERLPQFRDVTGLIQKYYSYDESNGEWAESICGTPRSPLRSILNPICARVSQPLTSSQNRLVSSAFKSWMCYVRPTRAGIAHDTGNDCEVAV